MNSPKLLKLPDTVTVNQYKNSKSYLINEPPEADPYDRASSMEVWVDDEGDVWVRHENSEAKSVDMMILSEGMATDLMGVLYKVLNER